MPNLLANNSELNHPLFKDANGQFPIVKEIIRSRVTYTILPNADAQVCFRIMAYEIEPDLYDAIVASPTRYSFVSGNLIIERYSSNDWRAQRRVFKGVQFHVDVPTRGRWGRYVEHTTRTVSAVNGKLTENRILRVKDEILELLYAHIENESEQQRARRETMEARERLSSQANTFLSGILEQFPLNNNNEDSFSWRNNYTTLSVTINLEKYQIGKVLDAIHRVRNMQTNPLDAEYLLKKDY